MQERLEARRLETPEWAQHVLFTLLSSKFMPDPLLPTLARDGELPPPRVSWVRLWSSLSRAAAAEASSP